MLCLNFKIGSDNYGISVGNITEIIPIVNVKELPNSPECLLGLINYRGEIIPLFDLSNIIKGKISQRLFSTRIVIVKLGKQGYKSNYFGLIAEQVTETIEYQSNQIKSIGVDLINARYLDSLILFQDRNIQLINIPNLIDFEIIEFLAKDSNESHNN